MDRIANPLDYRIVEAGPYASLVAVPGHEAALEAAIAPYRERADLIWTRSNPSLEDVFIDLMSKAKDNFQ